LARRGYWVRLNARLQQPWKRTAFRHPDLFEWAVERRGDILAALLTLARAYFAAGRPRPKLAVPTIGGFSSWARMVGGTLAHAGIQGFLTNLDALYEQVDEEEM